MHGIHSQSGRPEQRRRLQRFVLTALFAAMVILFSFTPLGFIQLVFIKATSIHIPVILGALLLGPRAGAILGLFFGLSSLINNSMNPSLLSCCFSPLIPLPGADRGSLWALVICLLPRVLLGVIAPLMLSGIERLLRVDRNRVLPASPDLASHSDSDAENSEKSAALTAAGRWKLLLSGGVSALFATILHTLMVMLLIQALFSPAIMHLKGISADAIPAFILGVITANGIPEALLAALVCAAIYPLLRNRVPSARPLSRVKNPT